MKICPKCGTPNQDKNYYCVECNAVLTGAKHVEDSEMLAQNMQKATKNEFFKKWGIPIAVGLFTIVMDLFLFYCVQTTDYKTGSEVVLHQMLTRFIWYIPIAVLAFVDFEGIYRKIRAKKGLPDRYLPGWFTSGVTIAAVVWWVFLQGAIAGGVLFTE